MKEAQKKKMPELIASMLCECVSQAVNSFLLKCQLCFGAIRSCVCVAAVSSHRPIVYHHLVYTVVARETQFAMGDRRTHHRSF